MYEVPGGFWRQIIAILMLFVAVILIFTWMGDGGDLLNTTDGIIAEWIGRARYLIPALLAWLSVKIFRSDGFDFDDILGGWGVWVVDGGASASKWWSSGGMAE